ncbi:MAG: alternative ribosome rescue aminoacyl-tRNA hydrolase ArfB [Phycisphaerae bacterium]|nr:alternative ribosome rescue aminoacyl-tRNA hydrolase ArfB [Phycisphaerae bacterium]
MDPALPNDQPKPVRPASSSPTAPPKVPVRPNDAVDLGKGMWAAKSAVVFTFSRSSGPGGQNVNKVNTRADLHLAIDAIRNLIPAARDRLLAMAGSHLVRGDGGSGSLHFTAEEYRSQFENREACIERLRALITSAATLPKKRKKTKPSRGSVQRRIEGKKKDGAKKQRRTERFE